jgi:hypothetical protein
MRQMHVPFYCIRNIHGFGVKREKIIDIDFV